MTHKAQKQEIKQHHTYLFVQFHSVIVLLGLFGIERLAGISISCVVVKAHLRIKKTNMNKQNQSKRANVSFEHKNIMLILWYPLHIEVKKKLCFTPQI